MAEISIHQAERMERSGRRFVALAVLGAIAIISATWIGLFAFLGANTAQGTLQDIRQEWIPDVEAMTLDLPDLSRLSEVYTSDGVLLGMLTERNSQPEGLDDIPNLVIGAVLAAEDADFMTHGGIDHRSIVRALIEDLGGGPTQGGSTITQQVVKQNFVGTEPTLRRKVAEAAIAIEVERRFTKEQILEFYLNSVFFGNNAYGVQAAAQEYFGKSLEDLTIAEAAALPVPIRNPSLYDLRNDSEIPLRARDLVLDQMVEEGYITAAEGALARQEPLATAVPQEFEDPAPQVLLAAKDFVLNDPSYGLGATYLLRKRALFGCPAHDVTCEGGGGLKVITTVDWSLQEQAREILQTWFPPGVEGPTGALAMVDNRTGATIVMASGLDFGSDIEAGQREYDLATKGRRNPGSSFKPFGLVAALENGIPLNSYWDMTTPQKIEFGGLKPWNCNNAGDNEPGIRSLEDALIASTNTVFCQLSVAVGPENIVDVAHRMGIRSPLAAIPAVILGAQAVSPLEMAAAYSTLANYGTRVDNYLIERIEDSNGNIVYQHDITETEVLDSALSAAVVNTMQQAVSRGTGGAAAIGRPQAGKTGTHEGNTDVWFVGFVPQYTTSVWVGFPDSQVEMRNITINGRFYSRAFGGSIAAPIWREFMEIATDGLPVEEFAPDPQGTIVYYATPDIDMPDVIGMTEEEATEELLQAGLDVKVTRVNADEPEDTVITSDPEPDEKVEQGTEVEIEVSNGRSPVTVMPDVVGLTRGEANQVLTELRNGTQIQFTWFYDSVVTNDRDKSNSIVFTRPEAGSDIDKDTVIRIRIRVFERATGGDPP